MSLRVWLPLINDLNNYGLSDVQMIDNGVTASENGKFGNCYYLNKKTLSCPNFTLLQNVTNFSACCWVKFTTFPSNSNAYCICLNNTTTSDVKFVLGIFSEDGETAAFRLNLSNSTGTLYKNQWYHLAICVAGTTGYLYINGKLTKTATVSTKDATNLIIGGRSTNAAGTAFTGTGAPAYYNDVRIYDHCLSKKEIHELAKGLILHYPLDNNGMGGTNLITTMTAGGRTTLVNKYSLDADFSQNADTYGYFNVSPALELGKTYTLSFDVSNFPVGSKWSWQLWNKAAYGFTISGNGRYTFTFSPNADTLPTDYSLTKFLFDDGVRNTPANTVSFSNFKIEAGAVATPFSPHPTDIVESALQIQDTSGYNHTGTAIQQMAVSSDTPHYSTCTQWKDSVDFIAIPALFNVDQAISELTITGWFKTNTLNNTAPNMFNFGANNFVRGRIAGTGSLWSYWNIGGARQGATTNVSTPTDNNWHHYAFVFDNGIVKVYYDGVLKSTNDFTANGTTLICAQVTNWGLGGYTPTGEKFIGFQSDFRTYVSALTDVDILELYETRPGVDKSGALYGYKLNETGIIKPAIRDTGVIEVPVAFLEEETTTAQAAKITKDSIIANAFYEI